MLAVVAASDTTVVARILGLALGAVGFLCVVFFGAFIFLARERKVAEDPQGLARMRKQAVISALLAVVLLGADFYVWVM